MIKILHNTRCTKSRCAFDILQKSKKAFEVIHYLNGELTEEILLEISNKTGKKLKDLIRTKEPVFKENYEGKKLTEKQWIKAILKYPVLLERPIVIGEEFASTVRSEEELERFSNFLKKQ